MDLRQELQQSRPNWRSRPQAVLTEAHLAAVLKSAARQLVEARPTPQEHAKMEQQGGLLWVVALCL